MIPTVNLMLSEERQYPAGGVYVTRTYTEQGVYQSVSNIGHNPTVGEGISLRCETYLLDCSADLLTDRRYGLSFTGTCVRSTGLRAWKSCMSSKCWIYRMSAHISRRKRGMNHEVHGFE